MNSNNSTKLYIIVISIAVIGLCLGAGIVLFGSGLTVWMARDDITARADDSAQPVLVAKVPTLPTNTATTPPTATPTLLPTNTPSPAPSDTPTATVVPTDTPEPTATSIPPTAPPPPPTETPPPTDTPTPLPPDFPFIIKENLTFPTNHYNFDVFIAIVNQKNKPLSGYRVIGTLDSGLQVESPVSAGDWTENSGAMHYKAGNVKFQVPNSPPGQWTLQLVNESNTPVSPPVIYNFDIYSPTWYFLIYEEKD
ncbi:MAG: hypothetical protein H6631_16015 [Anaerolineaceae bacterium]|nr:hypothetical protein [Anaerolineaceae bacterium]MCB9102074.1 hypothetical protein [Anaerolineales bacterium]